MGVALWLFVTANAYLWFKLINADQWMNCILLISCLAGGGTVADKWLATKKQPAPQPPAE